MNEPRIVHRDAHLLVVDKPAGLSTTAPQGHSLSRWVQEQDPRAPRLHALSRLDALVTGLVPFARTKLANEVALKARRQGCLHRAYLALASAAPAESGRWTWSIGLDPQDAKLRTALDPDESGAGVKHAATRFERRATAGPLSALVLYPETGRTHQLRVHAARAGAPLAGDVAYGGQRRFTLDNGRVLSARRVMLHCAALDMPDPSRPGQTLQLRLDVHRDMASLWNGAGGEPLPEPGFDP